MIVLFTILLYSLIQVAVAKAALRINKVALLEAFITRRSTLEATL